MVGSRLHTVEELIRPFAGDTAPALAAPVNQIREPMRSVAVGKQFWWHELEWAVHVCCCP